MTMFLLAVALVCACGPTLTSATNKTSCNSMSNNRSCQQEIFSSNQVGSMYCGLNALYDNCNQQCHDSRCHEIECRSLVKCDQNCFETLVCERMSCSSKKCDQYCNPAVCTNMKCVQAVQSCTQKTAKTMECEASACHQTCGHQREAYECRMVCPTREGSCDQLVEARSNATMQCERDECDQQCRMGGRCNMTCLNTGSKIGNCKQDCTSGTCKAMICNATNCTQTCSNGDCNMVCPQGSMTCNQKALAESIKLSVMQCHAEVCNQNCSNGTCNMACSAIVKHCYQTCGEGTSCTYKCDAENCAILDCSKHVCFNTTYTRSKGTSTTPTLVLSTDHPSASTSRIRPLVRNVFLLAFLFYL